jgi:hypothetical protein
MVATVGPKQTLGANDMTFTEPGTPVLIILSDGTKVPDTIWRLSKAQGITETHGIKFNRGNLKVKGYQPISGKAALTIEAQETIDHE